MNRDIIIHLSVFLNILLVVLLIESVAQNSILNLVFSKLLRHIEKERQKDLMEAFKIGMTKK